MWVVGVLGLVLVCVSVGQLIARGAGSEPAANLWDLPRTTSTYTSIVGMLAGFSVVVTIFFANLTVARSSPEFETVIGMLLVAFILFVASAMQFGTTPNLADRTDEGYLSTQRISYQLANLCYYCAITSSWLSLRLFLLAIGLPDLAAVFTWILFFAAFSGSLRMSQFTWRMSTLSRRSCMVVPFLAFGMAAVYRLAIAGQIPGLLPGRAEPFYISVCLFAAGALGFSWQSSLIMTGDMRQAEPAIRAKTDRLLLAYLQTVSTLVAMLWLSVALA